MTRNIEHTKPHMKDDHIYVIGMFLNTLYICNELFCDKNASLFPRSCQHLPARCTYTMWCSSELYVSASWHLLQYMHTCSVQQLQEFSFLILSHEQYATK